LYVAALAMTIREPRLWEYHNELVRGTGNAFRQFGNEGLDLGQRFHEVRAFHDRVIVPSGEPLYVDYWMGEQQIRAAGMKYRRRVESLEDTNVEGVYTGWFVYPMQETLPWPQWDWDPAVVFKDMRMVARFGHVGIWHGTMRRPQTRAGSLASKVNDYIYKENGDDWALVAARLEEVVVHLPMKVDSGVELGNAYLRLGQRDKAIAAYRRLLEQDKVPVEPMLAAQLQAHIDSLAAASDPAAIEPMRNPWLE
jgi:tetratricopeptide (TPR) repeat protein